jgi:hypothetical protein
VLLLVRDVKPLALVVLALLYVFADYSYFTKTGYLNKSYCVPYEEMAATISNASRGQTTVVLIDGYNSFSEPLLGRLDPGTRTILVDSEESAELVREAIQQKPAVIWFWRDTHDTSPGGFVSKLEEQLREGRTVTEYGYLPYSQPERWALRMLRGPGQPEYFYELTELR